MLTDIHILLTYQCTFECDHCFLYSGPFAEGNMTLSQIRRILEESLKVGTIQWIYFEGGEPFLFYPLLLEGVKLARDMGFQVGIVTNAFWAISEDDAELWLKPFRELDLDYLSISDDFFHHGDQENNSAKRALAAAHRLGMVTSTICIRKPVAKMLTSQMHDKGTPVNDGDVMFKGRAVEKLTAGLPLRSWHTLMHCPHEDLQSPSRVHVDPHGHIHICQGISIGNIWESDLSRLVREYKVDSHPICAPLNKGGPAALARHYDVDHQEGYVDECHFCYLVRRTLIDRFPLHLAPSQVYGLK